MDVHLLGHEPTLPRGLPSSSDVHIWVGQLEPRSPDLLSRAEFSRAEQYLSLASRDRYISRTVMLRQIIGYYLDAPPEAVQLSSEKWSRPRLLTGPDLAFSVSKVADQVVFAFRLGDGLGVDIEASRTDLDQTGLASRLLAVREQVEFAQVPPERRGDVLIQAWARKEAYVKGIGTGLRHPVNSFETGLEGSWRRVLDPGMNGPHWWVTDLPTKDGAKLALATEGAPTELLWVQLGPAVGETAIRQGTPTHGQVGKLN